MQVIEKACRAFETRFVARMIGHDAGEELLNAGRLLALVLLVLEVQVMNDLSDRVETRIVHAQLVDKHFESAALAVMRELRVVHVEADLIRGGPMLASADESKFGLGIDPAADEPG